MAVLSSDGPGDQVDAGCLPTALGTLFWTMLLPRPWGKLATDRVVPPTAESLARDHHGGQGCPRAKGYSAALRRCPHCKWG